MLVFALGFFVWTDHLSKPNQVPRGSQSNKIMTRDGHVVSHVCLCASKTTQTKQRSRRC